MRFYMYCCNMHYIRFPRTNQMRKSMRKYMSGTTDGGFLTKCLANFSNM